MNEMDEYVDMVNMYDDQFNGDFAGFTVVVPKYEHEGEWVMVSAAVDSGAVGPWRSRRAPGTRRGM